MHQIRDLFLNDKFILTIIVINTFTIFFEGFHDLDSIITRVITGIDSFITVLFLIEALFKIYYYGWKLYIGSNWNKLDFSLVILSLPSLFLIVNTDLHADLSFLLVFRISRIFKFIRFFKFIPGIAELAKGVKRALKTSVVVLFGFVVYNLIASVLSCYLFNEISAEYFGNPIRAFYSTFKVFTVEGWYEIPDKITIGLPPFKVFLIKLYFILILITGGIFGLSLVNSIFVDSMVSDNNDNLEKKVEELTQKINLLLEIKKPPDKTE